MANVTREQLQSIEWAVRDASDRQVTCPVCFMHRDFHGVHTTSCWLGAALASPPAEDELQRHDCEAWAMEGIGCAHCNPVALAIRAAQAPPASDPPGLVANWRPIETAPKRTDVLAGWADRPHWLPQVLQQDDAGMWFNGEESDYRPPTHWMPLPASPQAKED